MIRVATWLTLGLLVTAPLSTAEGPEVSIEPRTRQITLLEDIAIDDTFLSKARANPRHKYQGISYAPIFEVEEVAYKAYNNGVLSDKLLGKIFAKISGKVSWAKQDRATGETVVEFKSRLPSLIDAAMAEGTDGDAATYAPGDIVNLHCLIEGQTGNGLRFSGCRDQVRDFKPMEEAIREQMRR